jgi:nitrogen regulatory protein P-II 1
MRLVSALLQPAVLPEVCAALAGFGVGGLTVSRVEEVSRDRHIEVYRARMWIADSVSRIRVEIVVSDADAADVVRVIASAARSSHGDPGRVWTSRIDHIVSIRTGEQGLSAL